MGSGSSNLIDTIAGEVPAYVQRDGEWCGICHTTNGGGISIFQEPARFNELKPYELYQVSDDHWAALKLRVDPLARKILDPHRSIAGAAFLCLLLSLVFSVVSPSLEPPSSAADAEDDRDDYFSFYEAPESLEDDDVVQAEYEFRKVELDYKLRYWYFGFVLIVVALLVATVNIAMGMMRRNAEYDQKIAEVCEEMSPRFRGEGFTVGYRTNQRGCCFPAFRPVRVVVFRRLDGVAAPDVVQVSDAEPSVNSLASGAANSVGDPRGFSSAVVAPPQVAGVGDCKLRGPSVGELGTLVVQVPDGMGPGKIMTISTPSGGQVQASIPEGVRSGEQFTVQVPLWMINGGTGETKDRERETKRSPERTTLGGRRAGSIGNALDYRSV